ncbi:MAG: PrsW family intramembrane metalloprotease [Corynebacterium sp.]|nr:PrsW family intramembrane metalloprotease [Corynebacterium sp.]
MSRRYRILLTVLFGILAAIGVSMSLLTMVPVWDTAWVGVLFGAAWTALIIWLFAHSPLWPRGFTWKWVAACLLWGGGVALTLAMPAEMPLPEIPHKLGVDVLNFSIAGGYAEEIAKGLGAFLIAVTCHQVTRPWHGLVVGSLVGLGFEVSENVSYGAVGAMLDPNSDLMGQLSIWGLRMVAGPGLHIALTGLVGWGIGLYLTAGRSVWVPLGYLVLAMVLHGGWNLWITVTWQYILALCIVAAVLYGIYVWLIVRGWRLARGDATEFISDGVVMAV